ncbi:MAG: hypothetical protein L0Z63_01240 [Actinobacteria bacterium]|nr:hypothetical protein [Actinomycetota bacterium]
MARTVVAVLIVVGLAIGVWLLWPTETTPPGTTVLAGPTTTTLDPTTSATVVVGTTGESGHVVDTVEEAEAILRELWFGWFEGIYNQDEDRIREVVATEEQVATAKEQFEVMEFIAPPTPEALVFTEVEILRSDEECLAVWAVINAHATLGPGADRAGVEIVRWRDGSWVRLSSWIYRGDLWESDCESLLSSPSS